MVSTADLLERPATLRHATVVKEVCRPQVYCLSHHRLFAAAAAFSSHRDTESFIGHQQCSAISFVVFLLVLCRVANP